MIRECTNTPGESVFPERLIDELLDNGANVITVDEVMKSLAAAADEDGKEKLKGQVVRALGYHEMLVPEIPGERYVNAEKLFNGAEFMIVPDGFEIDNNILIPGHRFVPFMDQELFPSEITLKEAGAKKSQSYREFTASAEEIIRYHLLMGAETEETFVVALVTAGVGSLACLVGSVFLFNKKQL